MRIGVILSPGIALSDQKHPQYLDYIDMLQSLAKEHSIFVAGNMQDRPSFAADSASYDLPKSTIANKTVSRFAKNLVRLSNTNRFASSVRSRFEGSADRSHYNTCYDFFKKNQVDVLYSFPFYPDMFPVNVARELGIPIVTEFWEDQVVFKAEIQYQKGESERDIAAEMERGYNWLREVFAGSSRIIVPSDVFKDRIGKMGYGDKAAKAFVSAQPVELDRTKSIALRSKYDLQDKIVIYYSSAMAAWHDIDTLIGAVREIPERHDIALVVTGNPEYIKSKISQDDDFRTIVAGIQSQSDAYEHLAMADICVAPYKFHSSSGFFPGKIVRYMMASKPVVATDLDEVHEVLGNSGIFVAQSDVSAFAKALSMLINDKRLRAQLGAEARKIAVARYKWDDHSAEVGRVLESATERRSRAVAFQ